MTNNLAKTRNHANRYLSTGDSYACPAGCLSLKGPFILLILGLIALDLFRGPISVPNRRSLTNFSGGKRNEINLRCVKAQNFVI